MSKLGFFPDPFGHAICSYKYKNIPVDIMSSEDGLHGPSNPWYKIGMEDLWLVKVKNQEIKILSAPCYLATKFEAFNNRGNDYRTSHDMEDIIYVIDNRSTIVKETLESDKRILQFVRNQLQEIINKGLLEEVIMAHIHPLMMEGRLPLVLEKMNEIID